MEDCLFCKIAGKELESEIVEESGDVVAIRDVNPAAPSHILVIPKRHVTSARELGRPDGELLGELFEVMRSAAEKEGLQEGYRVTTNIGRAGGQAVDHLHFHVMGGRQMAWPPG